MFFFSSFVLVFFFFSFTSVFFFSFFSASLMTCTSELFEEDREVFLAFCSCWFFFSIF